MELSLDELQARFGSDIRPADRWLEPRDPYPGFEVPADSLLDILAWLRDGAEPKRRMLVSLTATDEARPDPARPDGPHPLRPGAPKRFRVVYHVGRVGEGEGPRLLRLVVWTGEDEPVPSCTGLFPGAAWMEREVFDLFGIPFSGHPDLKRILMPDGYDGHPLRKDFPLRGREPDRLYRRWHVGRGER